MAAETMIEPKSVLEVDQLQQETDRIEQINDDACVNSITNQKMKSGRCKKFAPQEKRSFWNILPEDLFACQIRVGVKNFPLCLVFTEKCS